MPVAGDPALAACPSACETTSCAWTRRARRHRNSVRNVGGWGPRRTLRHRTLAQPARMRRPELQMRSKPGPPACWPCWMSKFNGSMRRWKKSPKRSAGPVADSQTGVGPITSLAFVLTLGNVSRFPRGKQVASYLGLIPRERSSGKHQRFGPISKQGNRFLRMLLVEAAQSVVRHDPRFQKQYLHRCHSKPRGVAKVAAARKLAVRLYWMLRTQTGYPEIVRIESSTRVLVVGLALDRKG